MDADEDETVFPPFKVTVTAIDQIQALGGALRLDVEAGGCCGTTYVFNTVNTHAPPIEGDQAYGCLSARLIVGRSAAPIMEGATLDYAGRLKPARFRVLRNPNTDNVCACRRSFGKPWPGPGQPTCRSYQPMPWDTTYKPPGHWARQTGYTPPEV